MIDIVPHNECVGCHSCEAACEAGAIRLQADREGFLFPAVLSEICTNCKACLRVCSALNEQHFHRLNEPEVFASWSKNEATRFESSSGGLFTELAHNVFTKQGSVYGASFDANLNLRHYKVDNEDGLLPLKGSKYIQSNLTGVWGDLKKLLKKEHDILFVGTPCQVAGLNTFLHRDYTNLITCDVICHGVGSPGIFKKYLKELESQRHSKVSAFNFRAKHYGWKGYHFDIQFANGDTIIEPFAQNPFMKGFLADIYLRPSCYNCKYSRIPRVADITLGDFWGIWNKKPHWDDDRGLTALLINSKKGLAFISELKKIELKRAKLDWVIDGNPSLVGSAKPHPKREKFFKLYANGRPFEAIVKKILPPTSYLQKVVWSLRRRLKKLYGQ